MNSLKKCEGVPHLNFEGGPGIPILNFEGGPGVPLLNFRGVPGLTFKPWGVSRVPKSQVPESWSHFYTMPFLPNSMNIGPRFELLRHCNMIFMKQISNRHVYLHRPNTIGCGRWAHFSTTIFKIFFLKLLVDGISNDF